MPDAVDESRLDVAVVGAGISGLACAFACSSVGMQVAVFDEADKPGGIIDTIRSEGYMVEGGPQSYLSSPALSDLVDALGLRRKVVASAPEGKRRYIYTRRGLIPVPSSVPGLIMSPLISKRAKWRLVREQFVAARTSDEDESVAAFVRRRAGPEIVDAVAGPFLAGIYAGDVERISLRSAFPSLERFEREHGSVLRGLMKSRLSRGRPVSFTFADGNDALPLTLAASLGRSLTLGSQVTRIDLTQSGADVHIGGERQRTVHAKRVVIAVPAHTAARLIAPFTADAARELAAIEYAPIAQVALVYPRAAVGVPLDGFGFLATPDSEVSILGAVWNSVAFPSRSGKDHMLVTAFMGGALHRALTTHSDGDLVAIAHADLCKSMQIVGAKQRVAAVVRHNPGIPQYNVGHGARVKSIEALMAAFPAIALCGNYLRGVSIGDCVRQAREIALRVSKPAS